MICIARWICKYSYIPDSFNNALPGFEDQLFTSSKTRDWKDSLNHTDSYHIISTFKKENTAVSYSAIEIDEDAIENGIHIRTGFVDAEGLMTVVNNCTNCHSAKLVIQNRMNRARWEATIQWMQETQNLWDLGGNKEIIVNYLVTNYPPIDKGRRENLTNIEWYEVTN